MKRTRVCDLLGIEYPIIQGGGRAGEIGLSLQAMTALSNLSGF